MMKELKNDLKTGQYKRLYLLYGEEKYLVQYYERELREQIMPIEHEAMNMAIFSGRTVSSATIVDALETLPFFSEYRLVIVRDSGLFTTGRKDDTERLAAFVPGIPETTVVIFVEDIVDKRNRMYKVAANEGRVCEFRMPSEKELITWVQNICGKHRKVISPSTASLLLRTTAHSMDTIKAELDKLIAYTGTIEEICEKDIEAICTVSLDAKIFDLVKYIGNRRPDLAITHLNSLLLMREQPIMILAMIGRQFRLVMQSKVLVEQGISVEEIASILSVRGFAVREYLQQAKLFEKYTLIKAMEACVETDINIKTGRVDDRLAVETLIVSFST